MDKKEIAKYLDDTLLKADATPEQIVKICEEAKTYGCASVCVNSGYVPLVSKELAGSEVKTCCVIGFPLGACTSEAKAAETTDSIEKGANEVDMVINVGRAKAGEWDYVKSDIEAVVKAAAGKALVKVIIETCLLTDEEKIKASLIKLFPRKYKDKAKRIVAEGDEVLSAYIIGQAKVALSLAIMIFVGYKIIGMINPLLLASVTFILAFIPFIGFFISLILPYIIAIALGWNMILKLSILVIIAQTLKGRIVVPLIMGKTMKIHPITDIFLVVGAASIIGPIGAFVVVPIYSLIKVIYKYFNRELDEKLKEFKE